MNERDTTKLWYLADAIVAAPGAWRHLIRIAEEGWPGWPMPRMSRELGLAVRALETALLSYDHLPKMPFRFAAASLLKGKSACKKDAGRALSWALDLRGK